MQTETRTQPFPDLAHMMSSLPPAIAGGLAVQPGAAPRQNRRLPERILVAAHQACDLGDLDVAGQLLSILETIIGQSRGPVDPMRRRVMESLIATHQRIWHLRHNSNAVSEAVPAPVSPMFGFHETAGMADFQPAA